MAISPILLNGSIQQTDNVLHNQLKQVEKGMVDQGNIQVQEENTMRIPEMVESEGRSRRETAKWSQSLQVDST